MDVLLYTPGRRSDIDEAKLRFDVALVVLLTLVYLLMLSELPS
jgi:hypothetical protein